MVDFQANEMEKRSFDGPTNQMENFFFWIRILDALVDTIADGCVCIRLVRHQETSLKFPVEKIDVLGIIEKQVFELKKH